MGLMHAPGHGEFALQMLPDMHRLAHAFFDNRGHNLGLAQALTHGPRAGGRSRPQAPPRPIPPPRRVAHRAPASPPHHYSVIVSTYNPNTRTYATSHCEVQPLLSCRMSDSQTSYLVKYPGFAIQILMLDATRTYVADTAGLLQACGHAFRPSMVRARSLQLPSNINGYCHPTCLPSEMWRNQTTANIAGFDHLSTQDQVCLCQCLLLLLLPPPQCCADCIHADCIVASQRPNSSITSVPGSVPEGGARVQAIIRSAIANANRH